MDIAIEIRNYTYNIRKFKMEYDHHKSKKKCGKNFCATCSYWEMKIFNTEQKIEEIKRDNPNTGPITSYADNIKRKLFDDT